ncbi:gp53-like domain-containing protein [Citrobacter freundii]|uniref:Putative tail fiber protein gp53-like C-terminal domain-containing protein n=1 Tax=Citrobacter freundii TaxID=546 RepID=A0AAP5XY25_CITFR|nr:hypothetical protein [Citrobacter freundii]MDW2760772.1 hypothetical protein [Citrobacter freundii]
MRPLMPPVQTPDNLFHDGNPLTGELGTIVEAEHLNNVQGAVRDAQSELITVLTAAGINVDPSKQNQLLTALKALFLSRSTPFADIKSDGAAAIATALSNLGLGTAATKNVGVGAGQIPDMSSFTNASGWQKLPGGKILQWGKAGFPVGQTQISVAFPISFPSVVSNIQLTFADINFSGGTPSLTLAVVNNTVNGAGFGAYMSGAGGFNAYFFAIGS